MRNSLKNWLSIALVAITTLSVAQTRSIRFEHATWAQVLEKAKKENKLIYLDCFTTWCGPCKWMEKNVFTNDTVADFYNTTFVNMEMDMEKGEGKDLAKQYGIQAYPTMLYINAQGDIIHRTCGSTSPANFITNGKNAIDPEKQLAFFTKKFNNGAAASGIANTYFGLLQAGCQSFEKELAAYFLTQKDEDLYSRNNWNIIYDFVEDYSAKQFIYLERHKEDFAKLYSKDSVNNKINSVYQNGLSLAIRKKDDANYELIKNKIKESGSPDAEKIILDANLKLYKRNADWNNYAATAMSFIQKYGQDNVNYLNNIAWSFYENVTNKNMLEVAAQWAKHATELENNYANNDTYAALLFKLERKAQAEEAAHKAIDLAKKNGDNCAETEELLKKIKKLKD